MEAACAAAARTTSSPPTTRSPARRSLSARRLAFPALGRTGDLLFEDVGVPLPALPALVRRHRGDQRGGAVTIATVAHAGDGNTHPMIVFDPTDDEQPVRAQLAFGEVMELAISLGGTITGEHGVGRLKAPWLGAYLGPDVMALNRQIKQALDPAGILNPGAML